MLDRGRILVTGGAGLIGSALVWALNQQGFDKILIADHLGRSEKWRNLTPLRFVDYLEGDDLLGGLESVRFDDIRTVFHLGACSSTTETDAAYLIRNNFDVTKRLAAWSIGGGRRFVYASSAATYGALEGDLTEDLELATLRPLNMYGYSKHLFDVHAAREGFLDRVVGLKYFNVFGPNEDHKGGMRSMVHRAFHQIRETGRVKLFKSYREDFKDGEQYRDFLYVKDAVAMTIHLGQLESAGGLFNIGSGVAHTWLDLVHAVFAAMGVSPEIEFIDMPESLRDKYQYATRASLTRLRASGYFAPATALNDAVADYVRHYLAPGRHLGDELSTSAVRPTPA